MDFRTTADLAHVVCPHCETVNRVATDKAAHAVCGDCGSPLFAFKPVALRGASLERHIARSDVPVLVDFWAPWCAPCRVMAPVFEQAARELEPHCRLIKINTDEDPDMARRHGIRGIPTFVIFRDGREVARTSGAVEARSFMAWVRANTQ